MSDINRPRLTPKKIYLKDASFESPGSPGVFQQAAVNPDIEMNLDISNTAIDDDGRFFEVVLQITATATQDGASMFLVEVRQAGLFEINADDDKQKELLVQIGCPHMLLPFAREEIASLVSKGGFPQMLIAPVNFESVYRKKLEQETAGSEDSPAETG